MQKLCLISTNNESQDTKIIIYFSFELEIIFGKFMTFFTLTHFQSDVILFLL